MLNRPDTLRQIVTQFDEEHDWTNRHIGAIRETRKVIAVGGGSNVGPSFTLTKELLFTVRKVGPTTVKMIVGDDVESMPWSIELPSEFSAWQTFGIGAKVMVTKNGSPVTSPKAPSVTFTRVGNAKIFALRTSVMLEVGFYSNTASTPAAVAPPVAGDEGKFFLRLVQGPTTDEWKSSFVFLSGGSLTDYANGLLKVHCNGLITMLGG